MRRHLCLHSLPLLSPVCSLAISPCWRTVACPAHSRVSGRGEEIPDGKINGVKRMRGAGANELRPAHDWSSASHG